MNLQKSPDNNDELPETPPRQVTDNQATALDRPMWSAMSATATKNSNISNPMTTSCGTDADCQIEDDQWDVGEAEGVTVADPLLVVDNEPTIDIDPPLAGLHPLTWLQVKEIPKKNKVFDFNFKEKLSDKKICKFV